jgi:predicted DNA-binding transcriptional regulator YafY
MTNVEKQKVLRALRDPDHFALRITYQDRAGAITERVVSPIRMLDSRTMLALCLCRELPRRFDLDRCSDLELVEAHDILMPCPIVNRQRMSDECISYTATSLACKL